MCTYTARTHETGVRVTMTNRIVTNEDTGTEQLVLPQSVKRTQWLNKGTARNEGTDAAGERGQKYNGKSNCHEQG